MQVKILEPKGLLWEGLAKQIILPTEEGEMCVLDFHQPFVIRLKKGDIRCAGLGIRDSGFTEPRVPGPGSRLLVKGGIAFMQSNELSIFVER